MLLRPAGKDACFPFHDGGQSRRSRWRGFATGQLTIKEDARHRVRQHQDTIRISTTYAPDAIYVRGRYMVVPNGGRHPEPVPFLVLPLGRGHHSEGVGLLSLVEAMWIGGIQRDVPWPWWISS